MYNESNYKDKKSNQNNRDRDFKGGRGFKAERDFSRDGRDAKGDRGNRSGRDNRRNFGDRKPFNSDRDFKNERNFKGGKRFNNEYDSTKFESIENDEDDEREVREDIICGRNSVIEALKSGRPCESLLVAKGERNGSIVQILSLANKLDIVVKEVSQAKLDYMCGKSNHQGVVFIMAAAETVELDDLFAVAKEKEEQPFFIICDQVKDPHNLGAIIRTAEAVGAHGVIIPKRRSVGLTAAVSKCACGALEYVKVAKVTNLVSCIEKLKDNGVWVYGADMDGEDYSKTDLSGPIAVVIGSEGEGVSSLVKSKCDGIVSLPMMGHVNSLNASVAAGIIMYQVLKCRNIK